MLLYHAVIKTLIYADVFDYPLREEEIWRWLIKLKIKNETLQQSSGQELKIIIKKSKFIHEENGFYYLKGREYLIDLRRRREKWSKEKLRKAVEATALLKLIPTIKLVGITGALSMNNAKENDDIDLIIITSAGLLWLTRFLTTIIVELTGRRRHPGEHEVSNKICLNMFIDENHLEIPQKEQDLFSAHEVLQMKPLFVRDNIYQKFLQENNWVEKYLPNTYGELTLAKSEKDTSEVAKQQFRLSCKELLGWWRNQINIFWLIENFLKSFQLWYMRNRRTTEVIKEGLVRFHPQDARIWVLKKYQRRLERYKL